MNSGRTVVVQNGDRRSPAAVVIRGARQTLGGAVTVVGSVGTVAGRLIDGAGTVLDTTAGALSGTLLLVGDVLNTTGHVLGSTVSGLGGTITLAGNLVSGGSIADAAAVAANSGRFEEDRSEEATAPASPAGKPSVVTPKKTRSGGTARASGASA